MEQTIIDLKDLISLEHGLKPIRIHIWHDWIFINLNGKAKKFEEYAKPLIKKFKDINLKKIKKVATLDFGKINSNWKFLIENFIEPYHVQFVHKTTTKQPSKRSLYNCRWCMFG